MHILVLGMPFSGASHVARLLQSLGMSPICDEEDACDEEDIPACLQQSELDRPHKRGLDALFLDWNRIHGLNACMIPDEFEQIFQTETISFIDHMEENTSRVLYHPALCLLAPLWRRFLNRPVSVYVYRHPIEIAQDLQRRYDYPIPFGLALWEQYTIQSLKDTRWNQCILISSKALMKNPRKQARWLYRRLLKRGVPGLQYPSSGDIDGIMAPFQNTSDDPGRLLKEWGNLRQVRLCKQFRKEKLFDGARPLELSLGAQEQIRVFEREQVRKQAGDVRTADSRKQFYCSICQNSVRMFLPHGNPPRKHVRCPRCKSLARHRFDWIFFQKKTNLFDGSLKRMLHIAPEPFLVSKFQELKNIYYLSADLYRRAMVKMDITDIPFPDHTFDIIYCSHVLEHVVDDRKAIGEFYRVLKPGGWAVLQVPIMAPKTFEDETVTDPEDRLKIFGQKDHVRLCGPDYIDRMEAAGFHPTIYPTDDVLEDAGRCFYLGIGKKLLVFYCKKPID